MKHNGNVLIDRNTALTLPHPNMGYGRMGRKSVEDSSFAAFDRNKGAINILRNQRGFSWSEVHIILKNQGIEHSYPSLIQWKSDSRRFTDTWKERQNAKAANAPKVPELKRPVGRPKSEAVIPVAVKRGPGRPPKVLPPKRGRPPGSKNKPKV